MVLSNDANNALKCKPNQLYFSVVSHAQSHILFFLLIRRDPAALVVDDRGALAGRGVVVADPVAGDLASVDGGDEAEADLVGALELDVFPGEDKVLGLGREAGGDDGGFLDCGD